jgi:hypothetical protein
MAWQRYSKKEALNRIIRTLIGKSPLSDQPTTLSGSIISEDEALGAIAELFEESMPEEVMFVPEAATMRYGEIYYDHVTEGGATGTSLSLVTGTWTSVDVFASDGFSSAGITPEYASGLIRIGIEGTYFVDGGVAVEATADTESLVHLSVTLGGVRQEEIGGARSMEAAGAIVGNIDCSGFVEVDVGDEMELVLLSEDEDRTIYFHHSHLNVFRVGPKV